MTIQNNQYKNANYIESPNMGGVITPKFIVMHYTAGYNAESAINTLTSPKSKVSAHVVIDRDGTITQLVPFNRKAWHAGPSKYMGYNGMNNYSIGFEMVNIGWLRKAGNDYIDAYGNTRTEEQLGPLVESPNSKIGSGNFFWQTYTEEQLMAAEELTIALENEYDILDVTGHEDIDTRGWKTDPGPSFPMNRYKELVQDRNLDSYDYEVVASALRIRFGPGTEYESADNTLKNGDVVEIHEQFGDWGRIDEDGWIHMGFVRRV